MKLYKSINITHQNIHEALSEALEFIHSSLEAVSLNDKEINHAQLMAEEALGKLIEYIDFDDGRAMYISISKSFGKVTISLTVPGKEFDFVKSLGLNVPLDSEEITSDAATTIQNLLLRSFEDRLQYKHRNGYNRICVSAVKSAFTSLYWTLGALLLAVIAGVLLKSFASPAVCNMLNDNVFSPVSTIFMNALKMCAVPVVFLSIASCTAQFGGLSEIKRIGTSLLVCFVVMQCLSTVIGLSVFTVFQPGHGVEAASSSAVYDSGGASFSVMNTLINIIPSNVVRPFLEADMLQIILLAVFIGTAAGGLGAETIRSLLDESNKVFMKITETVMRFIPLVIFCSITSMLLTTGGPALLSLLGIVGTVFAGLAVLMAVYYLLVMFVCRLNPLPLFIKSLPVMLTSFSTSSSMAAIPDSLRCAENMGISPKIYSLAIPLGVSLNKNAMCMYIAAASLFLARVYGVEVSMSELFLLSFSIVALVMGAPSVPGFAIITFSILMSQLGVPLEAVSLIMGVNPVIDMVGTPCICFGVMTSTLLAASRSNMLDVDAYNRA